MGEPAAAQEAHREEDDGVALAADLVAGSEKSSNQHVPEGLDELLQPEDLVSPLPDATSSNKPRHQEMDLSSAEGILKGVCTSRPQLHENFAVLIMFICANLIYT